MLPKILLSGLAVAVIGAAGFGIAHQPDRAAATTAEQQTTGCDRPQYRINPHNSTPSPGAVRPRPGVTSTPTPSASAGTAREGVVQPSAGPASPQPSAGATPAPLPSTSTGRRPVPDPVGNGQPCPRPQGLNTNTTPGNGCFGYTYPWQRDTYSGVGVWRTRDRWEWGASERVFISSADQCVWDSNNRTVGTLDADGWLKVFDYQAGVYTLIWHGNSHGQTGPADYVLFQTDGNFVAYTIGGTAKWASNTYGICGSYCKMTLQDDGNWVIYDGWTARWATNTAY